MTALMAGKQDRRDMRLAATVPVLLFILMIGLVSCLVTAAVADDYPKIFRFGVLNVMAGVNPKDAQVVIEMNFVRQHHNEFKGIKSKLEMLADVDMAANLFRQKRLHGISLSGIDYLALQEKVDIAPLFISSKQYKPLEAYVLLASKEVANIEALSRLPRRRLVMENFGEMNVGQVWLDNVLWDKGYGDSNALFTQIRKVNKPARMVLPVFFGQAEVCLVPESAYHAMVELNPQIGSKLQILLQSPEFVRSIHCVSPSLNPKLVKYIEHNAVTMKDSIGGRQLMMVFQFKEQFLYDPAYIRETARVYRKSRKRRAIQ